MPKVGVLHARISSVLIGMLTQGLGPAGTAHEVLGRWSGQLSPQVLVCSATVPSHPGFGFGIRVVFAGQGVRISGTRGAWLKLKSWRTLPRMAAFSRTSGRESGRPSVAGLSLAPPRKSSSMNFR